MKNRRAKSQRTLSFYVLAAVAIGLAVILGLTLIVLPVMQQNTLNMVFVVEYEDDTEQRFEQPALSLIPLTIQDTSGKTIKSILTELYATVGYEGTITSWTITGLMFARLLEDGAIKYQQQPFPFSKSGSSSPPKNTPFVVTSAPLTAANIENMYTAWKPASAYGLTQTIQNVKVTVTFSDGTTAEQTISGAITGTWSFRYSSTHALSSVSVSWHTTPTY